MLPKVTLGRYVFAPVTNLTLKLYDEMCYINKFLACLHQRKILCIFKGLYHSCEEGNSIMLPH